MADALVTHLARALHLPPDAAQQTLHHLVSTLREQIEATGEASVPGLGVFRRSGARLAFEPDEALVRAVNHRYAGLTPVGAAPAPPRATPTREASPMGFQPLPSFIDDKSPDLTSDLDTPSDLDATGELDAPDGSVPDEGSLLDDVALHDGPGERSPDAVEEPAPDALLEAESDQPLEFDPEDSVVAEDVPLEDEDQLEETVAPYDLPDADDDLPDDDLDEEDQDEQDDQPDELASLDDLAGEDLDEAADELDEEDADEDSGLDHLLAGTWTEETDEAENHTHPLGPMPSDPVEEAEYSLIEAEDDDAEEDYIAVPLATPAADPLEAMPPKEAGTEKAEPVAPAVAALADADSGPEDRGARKRPNRGPLIAGLVVGTLLALAFLLWLRNREPAPPPIAERPPVADTSAATVPPVDTSLAALPADPVAEAPSADALRSTDSIDPADGGFTWVVGSELNRAAAERRVARYREQGLRAGVIAEEAAGRTRYRVSLGQFATIAEAEARRSDLPADVPSDSWILRL